MVDISILTNFRSAVDGSSRDNAICGAWSEFGRALELFTLLKEAICALKG